MSPSSTAPRAARRRPFEGDVWLLAGLLLLVFCVWVFVLVADQVSLGRAQPFDERLMRALRAPHDASQPVGPGWLPGAVRDVTSLGGPAVASMLVLGAAGALAVRRHYHAMLLLLASTIGGILLNHSLKGLFARPRPEELLRLTDARSLSFPSGHAMESAVIYLTLAAILSSQVEARALRVYFVGLAFLLTLLVGASRVYLGVHYPSDVLAGWTAGLAWALLCWAVARYLQLRGRVEPPE
jgi:undecaprenyl-diphosphatase